MQQVNPLVYRCRWLLWVPWLVAMGFAWEWFTPLRGFDQPHWWTPFGIVYHIAFFVGDGGTPDLGFKGLLGGRADFSFSSNHSLGQVALARLYPYVVGGLLIAFVGGGRKLASELPARRRPGIATLAAGGIMAGLLLAGGLFILLDLCKLWRHVALMHIVPWGSKFGPPYEAEPRYWATGAILLFSCVVMTVFIALWDRQSQRYWRFERLTRLLLIASLALIVMGHTVSAAGWGDTLSDIVNALPGTNTALVFAWTVLLWAWPARVILLFRLHKFEQAARDTHDCFACGYDLRGTLAAGRDACPECGASIPVEQRAAAARSPHFGPASSDASKPYPLQSQSVAPSQIQRDVPRGNPVLYQLRWLFAAAWFVVLAYAVEWMLCPVAGFLGVGEHAWTPFGLALRLTPALHLHVGTLGFYGFCGIFFATAQAEAIYWSIVGVYSTVWLILLARFFDVTRPSRRTLSSRSKLDFVSRLTFGLMAGMLVAAGVFILLDWFGIWREVVNAGNDFPGPGIRSSRSWIPLATTVAAAAIMTYVVSRVERTSPRYWRCVTLTRYLLIASVAIVCAVSAVRTTPGDGFTSIEAEYVDTMFGTKTGLIYAWTVLLWAWGARLMLLLRQRKFEQAAHDVHDCYACGYDLRGTLAAQRDLCPECGATIPAPQLAGQGADTAL